MTTENIYTDISTRTHIHTHRRTHTHTHTHTDAHTHTHTSQWRAEILYVKLHDSAEDPLRLFGRLKNEYSQEKGRKFK